MASIGPRLRSTQALLSIRMGSGAVKLPQDVQRIHLGFSKKSGNGHMGPRKFWHNELIRLKYHNPAVSMTVDRSIKTEEQATLTVFFAPEDAPRTSGSPTSGTAATTSTSGDKEPSEHVPAARTKSVSVSHKVADEILKELISITKAQVIEPASEDLQLETDLEEFRKRQQEDRERSLALNAEKKRQEELLAEARGQT